MSKNQDSDDNTISSNEKKIVRKSPPQIIVHKSQPSDHKQGTRIMSSVAHYFGRVEF